MHNSLMQIKLFNKWNHQKVYKDKPKTGSKTWKISRKVWVFGVKSAKSLPHFPQFSPWGERMGNGEFENQYSPIFPMMGNIGDPPYSKLKNQSPNIKNQSDRLIFKTLKYPQKCLSKFKFQENLEKEKDQ